MCGRRYDEKDRLKTAWTEFYDHLKHTMRSQPSEILPDFILTAEQLRGVFSSCCLHKDQRSPLQIVVSDV